MSEDIAELETVPLGMWTFEQLDAETILRHPPGPDEVTEEIAIRHQRIQQPRYSAVFTPVAAKSRWPYENGSVMWPGGQAMVLNGPDTAPSLWTVSLGAFAGTIIGGGTVLAAWLVWIS